MSERTLGVHRSSVFYHNSKWHAQIIGTNSCHFPHNCRLCFFRKTQVHWFTAVIVVSFWHINFGSQNMFYCVLSWFSPYRSHFRPEHGYVPIISPFITKQINMSNFRKLIELSLSKPHLIVIAQCFPWFSHYPGFPSGFPMISIISMFFHVLVYVAFQGFPSNWCSMLFLWIFHGFPCFSYGFSLVFPVFFHRVQPHESPSGDPWRLRRRRPNGLGPAQGTPKADVWGTPRGIAWARWFNHRNLVIKCKIVMVNNDS